MNNTNKKFTRIAAEGLIEPGPVNSDEFTQTLKNAPQYWSEGNSAIGNFFQKMNPLSRPTAPVVDSIDSVAPALKWLKPQDKSLFAYMLKTVQVNGVAIVGPDGEMIGKSVPLSLQNLLTPGKNTYQIVDPDAFNASIDGFNEVLAGRVDPNSAGAFRNLLSKSLRNAQWISGMSRVLEMGIAGSYLYDLYHKSKTDEPVSTDVANNDMTDLSNDPSMQTADFSDTTDNAQPTYNAAPVSDFTGSLPSSSIPNTPTPSFFNNNQYDSMGYLKSSNNHNDTKKFSGFNIGFGYLGQSVNPHSRYADSGTGNGDSSGLGNNAVSAPGDNSNTNNSQNTSSWQSQLLSPSQLLQQLSQQTQSVASLNIDDIVNTFMKLLDTDPTQAATYIKQQADAVKGFSTAVQSQFPQDDQNSNSDNSDNSGMSSGSPRSGSVRLSDDSNPGDLPSPTNNPSTKNPIQQWWDKSKPIDPATDLSTATKSTGQFDEQGDSPYDSPATYFDSQQVNEQAAASSVQALGVDRDQYGQIQKDLQVFFGPAGAQDYITYVASLATASGSPISAIMPTAQAIATRFPTNPESAKTILGVIAKYAEEYPTANIWSMANNACTGKDFTQDLQAIRMMGMAKSMTLKNLENPNSPASIDDTSDLSTAMTAILNPNTPIGGLANQDMLSKQKMQNSYQQLKQTWGVVWDRARIERNQLLTKTYTNMADKIKQFAGQQWFQNTMDCLNLVISSLSQYKAMISVTNAVPDSGFGGIGQRTQQSSRNRKFVRLADQSDQSGQTQQSADPNSSATTIPSQLQYSTQQLPTGVINQAEQQSAALANGAKQPGATPTSLAELYANRQYLFSGNSQNAIVSLYTMYQTMKMYSSSLQSGLQTISQGMNMGGGDGSMNGFGVAGVAYLTPQAVNQKLQALKPSLDSFKNSVDAYAQNYISQANAALSGLTDPGMSSSVQAVFDATRNEITGMQQYAKSAEIQFQQIPIALESEIKIQTDITPRITQLQKLSDKQKMIGITDPGMQSTLMNLHNQKVQIYNQAGNSYLQLAQQTTDPGLQQVYRQLAQQQGIKAQTSSAEAMAILNQVGAGIGGTPQGGGGSSPSLNGAFSSVLGPSKFIRLGEEKEVEADQELEDYWDDLLPGYGTTLEHPVGKEKIPTNKLAPKKKFLRIKQKINLSE